MIQIKHFVKLWLFYYSILLFIVSCHTNIESSAPTTVDVSLKTPVSDQTQPTAQFTATSTVRLPVSTEYFVEDSVENTTKATIVESSNILPTLPSSEAQSFVLTLTMGNDDCLLPCFWGIMPGETVWRNIQPLLATFAHSISYRNIDGTFTDEPVGNDFVAWVYVFLPEVANAPFSYAFNVQDNIIAMVEAHVLPVPNGTLWAVLDMYGSPDEVWVLTSNASMGEALEFRLTLFYRTQSFILTYSAEAEITDNLVKACFSTDNKASRLVTWHSEESLKFSEVINGVHEPRPVNYDLVLEEATAMDTDAFYHTVKNTKSVICLETPTELWPGP